MDFKITGAFLIYFIIFSSLDVTTMDDDVDVDLTLNRSTPIRCFIKDESKVAHLTCTFPVDVRQKRLNFNIKASQESKITSGVKLMLNCLWLPNLICVGRNGSFLLQEDKINTNVTVHIPITDALSHSFTCHLSRRVTETHSCTLAVFDNDSSPAENEMSSELIALVVVISVIVVIGISIISVVIIRKQKNRKRKFKMGEEQDTIEEGIELIKSISNDQSNDKCQYPPTEILPIDCQPVNVGMQFEKREKDEEFDEVLENLYERSCILPDSHLSYVHTIPTMIGPQKVDVMNPMDNPTNPIRQRIRDVDETKLKIHECLSKIKQLVSHDELVAILAQISFSLYGAGAAHLSEMPVDTLDQILQQKEQFSDFVIINQQRGVLGGIVLSDHVNSPDLEDDHFKMSTDKLLKCRSIIEELLSKVPKAEEVGVYTTLVLHNITRKQLPKAFSSVPCLFKDDMETEEGLRNWWNACWASGDNSVMDVHLYRNLVYRFAVPALRAQAKLNNGATGRLTNNHETKTATANFIIYDPTKPSQYLLFPSEEKLLDFDSLDAAGHDIKILTGPPGAGKSMLIRLRALQWVSHFAASNIIILQTTKDGTAAACVLEHQLEQMLRDQECTFTPVNLSGAWERKSDLATGMTEADLIEAIESNLGLLRGSPPDAAIHIVAVEADGNVIRAVYQWLTENSQAKIRMWVAGVEVFEKLNNLPSALRRATVHVTSEHLFHGPPEQQILRLASGRDAAQTDLERDSAGGQPIKRLRHVKGLSGHDASPYPWSCARCATAICQQLKELLVGEADDGRQGLSANDVFILAKELSCEESDVSKEFSAAPLLKCLQENGYNVCTVNSDSSRDHIMSIIKKTNKPPAITVSSEKYLWYLKREVIVYCESSSDADAARKVWTLHKATPTLINIKPE